jgi:hypothetical protein
MDCVGKAANVMGNFASSGCSGFDVSFEVKLSVKPDPSHSQAGWNPSSWSVIGVMVRVLSTTQGGE